MAKGKKMPKVKIKWPRRKLVDPPRVVRGRIIGRKRPPKP